MVLGIVTLGVGAVFLIKFQPTREILRRLAGKAPKIQDVAPAQDDWQPVPNTPPGPEDWRGWRGNDFTNIVADWSGPLEWSDTQGLLWKTKLPGKGNSTPIVVNGQIYLTTADEERRLWLVQLDFQTGQEVRRTEIFHGDFPSTHERTSNAASTPACDGERIFVVWADPSKVHLTAFDLEGKRLWSKEMGEYGAGWGYAASPLCADGLVLVSMDNPQQGFLTAVRADSGDVFWRRIRPDADDSSYSSPALMTDGDKKLVVMNGLDHVQAFDLVTGKTVWECEGPTTTCATTPVFNDKLCVVSGGYPNSTLLAISTGGESQTPHIDWKVTRSSEVPYVPTPLLYNNHVFVIQDDGLAISRDATTGKIEWKRRLGGKFSASPLLLKDAILCIDEVGTCSLLNSTSGEIIQQNSLPHGCFASPVPIGNKLLIRTTEDLYCVGQP
ncbi:PQQ-binding-like beta-propeller repeat protein [Planctomicrobium sp. SH661]|uniref:outer membrane protein assembly factor BamB family protein n=1 Tax=Planctomicrobium sp. SH661 TaxID=3448124 RepID=UPI003F5C1334